jgi:hypothetical protein
MSPALSVNITSLREIPSSGALAPRGSLQHRPQQPLRQRPVTTTELPVHAAASCDRACLQSRAGDSRGVLQVPELRRDEMTLPTPDRVELKASRAGDDPTGSEWLAAVVAARFHRSFLLP